MASGRGFSWHERCFWSCLGFGGALTEQPQTDLVTHQLDSTSSVAPRPFLVVLGPGRPTVLQLPAGRVILGRASDCTVQIDHQTVSRRHAALETEPALRLQDLGSSNGTRVGGRHIESGQPVRLRLGEVFELGKSTMLVHASPHLPSLLDSDDESTSDRGEDDTGLIVGSAAMRRLLSLVGRVAKSRLNVLITGETGVGKERIADLIHERSAFWNAPMVKINCGAFSPMLLESELFGHIRGAFTGATRDKPGLLEQAAGGTVFLDEVCALPAEAQAKLLRVVQERCVRRVGDIENRPTAERFLAATSRDIDARLESGRFRTDLYYRLAGVRVAVPALRERSEEIRPLTHRLLDDLARRDGVYPPRLADDVWRALEAYAWPGNVRELRNVLERAWVTAGDGDIERSHLPPEVAATMETGEPPEPALFRSLESVEKQKIVDALARCDGNQTRAAKLLGISRRTLVNRLDKYDLPRPRKCRD